MNEESRALAKAWMAKAQADLAVARLLIHGDEPHRDAGVYHSQQAAEKALKALLTLHQTPFPKTHALRALLDLTLPIDPKLFALVGDCIYLTPFATQFRYPGDVIEPDVGEAVEALQAAQRIVDVLKQQLDI